MANPTMRPASSEDHRRQVDSTSGPIMSGVPVRDIDIESATGLHWVAKLFRVMAGLLGLLMAMQVFSGLTSSVEISYGVLFAEAIRLLIFAGLLWGAGDLADLFVKSHSDLRATKILVSRLARAIDQMHEARTPPGDEGDPRRGRGDATH